LRTAINSNTAIIEAKAIYLKDADGNQYFDCLAGAATLALGNNHTVVLDARKRSQSKSSLTYSRLKDSGKK
jgi:4-aminobutyrate aminotransferase-like enzyme